MYDSLYVANMCKADFYGSCITTDINLAKFVKDYLDDEDGYDGIAFNRFLADCARKGIVINWENMIWYIIIFQINGKLFFLLLKKKYLWWINILKR